MPRLLGITLKPFTPQAASAVLAAFVVALFVGYLAKWTLELDGLDVQTMSLSVAGGALAATLGADFKTHGWRAAALSAFFAVTLAFIGVVLRGLLG